jgi:hypothetical protein
MAKTKDSKKSKAKAQTKRGRSKAGGDKNVTQAAAALTLPAAVRALASVTDPAHVEATLTSSQCIVWRFGEFRQRVTQAVAEWAQVSASSISSSDTLGALAKGGPWNEGQQGQLVNSVNANRVFEPPFPGRVMNPPSQLVPASTTVLQWEGVVWRHQNPLTPCFAFTD